MNLSARVQSLMLAGVLAAGCANSLPTVPPSSPAGTLTAKEEAEIREPFFLAASYIETEILRSHTNYRVDFDMVANDRNLSGHYAVRRQLAPRLFDAATSTSNDVVDFSVEYGAGTVFFERRQYVYGAQFPYPLFVASKTTLAQNRTARRKGSNWFLHINDHLTDRQLQSRSVSLLNESAAKKIRSGFIDDLTLFVETYARYRGIYANTCSEAHREQQIL